MSRKTDSTQLKEAGKSQYDGLLAARKKKSRKSTFLNMLPLYLMMLPGLIYLVCNNYLPMFGILIAFKRVNFSKGILASPWVGLDNFEFLFKTKDAMIMIRNTLAYNVVWIILGMVIAVFIAICMSEISSRPIAKVIQPVICFPSMVSAVILSFIVYAFLSTTYGYVNTAILHEKINWYATAKYWPVILTIVHFWQSSGQSSIIYMASIGGIDKGLYESARIDGASPFVTFRKITLPYMLFVTTPALITTFAGNVNNFNVIYLLSGGRMVTSGTPEEVFSRPEILRENHLRLPRIAHLMEILNDRDGVAVSRGAATISAARQEILRLLAGEALRP